MDLNMIHGPWSLVLGEYCNFKAVISTLTAIIFLHYRVATKMALEVLVYTMCRVRLWWLVNLPFELSKLVYAWLEGGGAISLGNPRLGCYNWCSLRRLSLFYFELVFYTNTVFELQVKIPVIPGIIVRTSIYCSLNLPF